MKSSSRTLIDLLSLNKSLKPSHKFSIRFRMPKAKTSGRKSR
jgi:hypothetical protein